jgi:hypothetical protein
MLPIAAKWLMPDAGLVGVRPSYVDLIALLRLRPTVPFLPPLHQKHPGCSLPPSGLIRSREEGVRGRHR